MCRLTLYMGPEIRVSELVTEPAHSIIHQSYKAREREEPLNGDGFGIAWYVPEVSPEPAVFKEVHPAWNSLNLRNLAPVSRSGCILAHVRAATGALSVSQRNCHPFWWRQYAFMHNGSIGGFESVRRRLMSELRDDVYNIVRGTTDSEIMFAHILDRLGDDPGLEAMADALASTIEYVEQVVVDAGLGEPNFLNLVLTDGRRSVASRYVTPETRPPQTLYARTGSRYRIRDGQCVVERDGDDARAVLIASEPLNEDQHWKAVEPNALLMVDETLSLTSRRIN